MALLFIREYDRSGGTQGLRGETVSGDEPGLDQAPIAIGAGSVQSAAFASGTRLIRVHTDVICSIKIGDAPTAAITHARMAANTTEYFSVKGGQKLAVIANT